ncbi:hypothetical protein LNP74_28250 [Klebsiella pneumoniae subsp. pneumoniae]|nr:hypothetical protein [Klebsiella pneumoniae subsp. pneumoniae]
MAWIGSPGNRTLLDRGLAHLDAGAARVSARTRHVTTMLGMVEARHRHCRRARDVDARREHSVLRCAAHPTRWCTRTVGLIRLSGRIQSCVAAGWRS